MNAKHILLTCMVSIVTSVAVCLVFVYATRTSQMAGPQSTEISAEAREKTVAPSANPAAPREEMESLRAAVERLELEVGEFKRREGASTSSGDQRKSAVRELLERPHLNNEVLKEVLGRIMLEGDGAVDEIVRQLRTGKNVNLGGGMSTSGAHITSFPDLNTALLYTLYSMGSDASRTACFQYLAEAASLEDMGPILSYFNSVGVEKAWQESLKCAVARGIRLVGELDREGIEKMEHPAWLVRGVCAYLDRFDIPGAAGALRTVLEKKVFKQKDERFIVEGLLAASPEEGAAYLVQRCNDPGYERSETLSLLVVTTQLPLPSKIEAAKALLARGGLSAEERKTLLRGLAFSSRTYGRMFRRRSEAETEEHLRALLQFLESSMSAEPDPGVREALGEGIATVKEQIG